MDPDDGASLQYVPGAASIPEIEKLKTSTLPTGFVLRTEDGQEVGGPKERSSYDDVVAAFGQPVSSTDSANPGDGSMFGQQTMAISWLSSAIMC